MPYLLSTPTYLTNMILTQLFPTGNTKLINTLLFEHDFYETWTYSLIKIYKRKKMKVYIKLMCVYSFYCKMGLLVYCHTFERGMRSM